MLVCFLVGWLALLVLLRGLQIGLAYNAVQRQPEGVRTSIVAVRIFVLHVHARHANVDPGKKLVLHALFPLSKNPFLLCRSTIAIATRAAEIIDDGETVLLDGGTTTYEVARLLVGRSLQVVTNSLPVANLFLALRTFCLAQ